MTLAPNWVHSADGTRLAVYDAAGPHVARGAAAAPTIVAIHGYPDDHSIWDGMAAALASRFRIVTYDVRGSGRSDHPVGRRAYAMPALLDDLRAVLDAVAPASPVHLVGHDWGSIQGWAAVGDEQLQTRIAGYTSISGPDLGFAGAWLRDLRAHPRTTLRQLAHSYYLPVFQVPGLAELAVRSGALPRLARHRAERRDWLAGLQLYRANLRRPARPRAVPIGMPVQLIVPDRDPFVTPDFAVGAAEPWVPRLTVTPIAGGHWVMVAAPEQVAAGVAAFVDAR